jgi:hypothetical protein
MTARAVSKSILNRTLDMLAARGTPARKIELRPDGKTFLHLVGANDDSESEGGANPWDVVLAED